MQVTLEISFYPLTSDYEESVIGFIHKLKENEGLLVLSNAMSTYVKGHSKDVFYQLEIALSAVPQSLLSATIIKLINRDLPIQKGFLDF